METSRRNLIQGAGLGLALAALNTRAGKAATTDEAASVPAAVNDIAAPGKKLDIVNFDLLEKQAKGVLSEAAYAFIAHAAGDEWTLHENRRAFADYPILTHRLAGVAAKDIDLNVDILGQKLAFPIVVAPMGAHLFAHPDAEVATAAGASARPRRSINPQAHPISRWKPSRRRAPARSGSSFTSMRIWT